MQRAIFHAVCLLLAITTAWLGRFVTRYPARMVRFFIFGVENEPGFFVAFSRAAGWLFMVMGILGAILYIIMIPVDLLSK
jgi:hypothetical protein